jgi:hypothetical protein
MREVFAAIVLAASAVTSAFADWQCRCGTIVHVDYPTTCPVCGRSLPEQRPPFTPPSGSVNDGTGVRLGVSIYQNNRRVIVSRVEPGTPAEGLLFPNDQLVRAAFRDAQNGRVFRMPIYTPSDVTRLKSLAGAGTRVALEVFRPTSGLRNFFVEFAPDRNEVYTKGGVGAEVAAAESAASISEDTTGEAAGMLGGGSQSQGADYEPPRGGSQGNSDSAADLLGR